MFNFLMRPGAGDVLRALRDEGELHRLAPELAVLNGLTQPERYHPEGDVLEHVACCLDAASNKHIFRTPECWAIKLSLLLHDIGKAAVVVEKNGENTFPKHAQASAEQLETMLERIGVPEQYREEGEGVHGDWYPLREKVKLFVKEHHAFLNSMGSEKSARKSARKLLNKKGLEESDLYAFLYVLQYDMMGKGMSHEDAQERIGWILDRFNEVLAE